MLALCFCMITACAPRGESRSVKEVLEIQSSRFADASRSADVSPAVKDLLGKVEAQLIQISGESSAQNSAAIASQTASLLSDLTARAGYTSRPALSEIASQFRVLANADIAHSQATLQLLAARTYSVLTAELMGVKFAIS